MGVTSIGRRRAAQPQAAPKKEKPIRKPLIRLTLRQRRAMHGYLFIMLWAIGFLVFQAWPFIQSFWLSFNSVDMMAGFSLKWVALDNYRELFFVDERFVPTLLAVLRDMAIDVPIILVFSLVTAFLVNQPLTGRLLFRAIFFLPVVIASGEVLQYLYPQLTATGNTLGSTAAAGRSLDIPAIAYMYLPPNIAELLLNTLNRLTLILWRSGIQILLFLAGLQGISSTLYEAAKVDGASDWEVFWKVTLPMLSPIFLVNVIYSIVDSFTDRFNPMLGLIRAYAFTGQFKLGYAAAAGWVYFLVIFIILMVVMAVSSRWVFYSGERD